MSKTMTTETKILTLAEVASLGGKFISLEFLSGSIPGKGIVYSPTRALVQLPNGQVAQVDIQLPGIIPKYRVKNTLIYWAKTQGVFAKPLGLFNESIWQVS